MTHPERNAVMVAVLDPGPLVPMVDGAGEARAVVWPGTGAALRSMQRISLGASSSTVELCHHSEAVYYVITGEGQVREQGEPGQELREGSMFLVGSGTAYVVEATAIGMELVGGPCPPDPALYDGLAT